MKKLIFNKIDRDNLSQTKLMFLLMFLFFILILGVSYALWQLTFRQTGTNTVTTGCFKLEFNDENPINLQEALPITDEDGKNLVPYEFTLTNSCDSYANYQINLEVLDNTTINNLDYIKVQYENNEPELLSSYQTVDTTLNNAITSQKLSIGYLDKNETVTLHLRLWLDEDTPTSEEMMNQIFASKVTVTLSYGGTVYKERILNGTDPVLKDELIPVTIDDDGTVHKANINEKWYSYEEKIWANSVILKDETKTFQNNEVIPEETIESYFVWIPRYKYKIFNDEKYNGLTDIDSTKEQTIKIEFESKDVTPSTGKKKNEWLTHPAFTSFNSNGMWVGKFETSKSNNNPDNSRNGDGVQIKPNKVSWRNIQVGNAFYTTYDYKRNLDSHVMKNSEWGSVAYLQHSKYGLQDNLKNNNNHKSLTGYSSVRVPTCGYTDDSRDCNKYGETTDVTLPYNTEIGHLAATTGNISGIYDIDGGAWEYVMGVMMNQSNVLLSGRNASNNSLFNGAYSDGGNLTTGYSLPNVKYYDKYLYGSNYLEFTRGHLGDATTEAGPFKRITYANNKERRIGSWGNDLSEFVHTTNSWFIRGGSYISGSEGGAFAFGRATGAGRGDITFRIVLAPSI